jgi:uncharacterized protein YabE (DUF348 family)
MFGATSAYLCLGYLPASEPWENVEKRLTKSQIAEIKRRAKIQQDAAIEVARINSDQVLQLAQIQQEASKQSTQESAYERLKRRQEERLSK